MPVIAVVVVGVVVEVIVFLIVVMGSAEIDPSSSITFSEDDPVPFIASCRQHRILVMGHCTSSRTSSHINVANACTHTPGQSAIFAVLVKELKNPMHTKSYKIFRHILQFDLHAIKLN